MNKYFEQIGFLIETTGDQSPTLKINKPLFQTENGLESMHHSGGAATETDYIYGNVLKKALQVYKEFKSSEVSSCRTAVVGLGLGYIEISWAISILENNLPINFSNTFQFDSFEVVQKLKDSFLDWIQLDSYESKHLYIYDQLCLCLIKLKNQNEMNKEVLTIQNIKNLLKNKLKQDSFLHAGLENFLVDESSPSKKKWTIVCYDAFSKKTTSQLWTYDFLDQLIKSNCDDDCVFTTYACTGELKKALQQNGFKLLKRPGFQGKRDSTLALRGFFKSRESLFQIF